MSIVGIVSALPTHYFIISLANKEEME